MMKTSERVWSLGGMAVGPVAVVGAGGTDVGVRTAVALGAPVAVAATVTAAAAAVGVAGAPVAVAGTATAVDAGVGVLAPAGVPGTVVATDGAGAQACTATIKNDNMIQRKCLASLVIIPLLWLGLRLGPLARNCSSYCTAWRPALG